MTENYPEITFSSVDELASLLTVATEHWDSRWFRGCTSPAHALLPSLFRDSFHTPREGYLAIEFRRRAHHRLRGVNTQFDWLCAMQHYGLPTRLLDWSESLSVALYFSIGDIDWKLARPTIWVLDPFMLALVSDNSSTIPISTSISAAANADIAFQDDWVISEKLVTKVPLPVAPSFLFDRMAAQNCTFTLHGTDTRPLEDQLSKTSRAGMLKFVAAESRCVEIVNAIRLIRPSPDAIFPDIEGMKTFLL